MTATDFFVDGFRFENVGSGSDPMLFGATDEGDYAVIGAPGDWVVCDANSGYHEDTAVRHKTVEAAVAEARKKNNTNKTIPLDPSA